MNPGLRTLAGSAGRAVTTVAGRVSSLRQNRGVMAAIAILLFLAGLYYLAQFATTYFKKPVEYVNAVLVLQVKDTNVSVEVAPVEVGFTRNPRFYGVIRSSWSECDDGVRYTVTIDNREMLGPYCSGSLAAGLASLLKTGLRTSLIVQLPPGYHRFSVVVMGVGEEPVYKVVATRLPSVDEVKRCGGVWPCGGENVEQNR